MRIVIAGAGEVGRHSAEVLAGEGHHTTIIDRDPGKLESIAETIDAATLLGSATHGDVLREAGVAKADLFVAATDADETNLLSAAIAKGIGAAKVIARVHHGVYYARRGLDYARHLGIDRLVCPEYLTSLAIAGVLRDPAVQAIEHFARGRIVMERLVISDKAEVVGKPLKSLNLPPGVRIGTVTQKGRALVPTADTVLMPEDQITLIGTTEKFETVLPKFRRGPSNQQKIVIMGGSPTVVWLCRALDRHSFRIRLFVNDLARAEELAEKLPHVTVLQASPIDPDTFDDENIEDADAFVALTNDDEDNILGALQARHLGVQRTVASVTRSTYHQLIEGLGIDHVFSPRFQASREIERLARHRGLQLIAGIDEHGTGIYEMEISVGAPAAGQSLMEMRLPPGCVLIAIQRGDDVHVPGPKDILHAGDAVVAITQEKLIPQLKTLFT
jgi:trk system potassium uptake protein TrkA